MLALLCGLASAAHVWVSLVGWVWGGVGIPAFGDAWPYFLPLATAFRESLLAGQIPAWSPHQAWGFYLLGCPQMSMFYVINYVLLVPFPVGFILWIVAPYGVHAAGLYILMRKFRYGRVVAFLIAASFSGCGMMLALNSMPTAIGTLAWLPWVLVGMRCWKTRAGRLLLGFALSQSFLAGAWDVWICVVAIGVCVVSWPRFRWGYLVEALVFSAALVFPQLVQSVILFKNSNRAQNMDASTYMAWSTQWIHLLGIYSPRAQISDISTLGWYALLKERSAWLLSTYFGQVVVFFLPGLFLLAWKRRRWIAIIGCVSGLVISGLGNFKFLIEVLDDLGLRIPFRYPDKFFLAVVYVVSMAAFLSLRTLTCRFRRAGVYWRITIGWLLAYLSFFFLVKENVVSQFRLASRIDAQFAVPFSELYSRTMNFDLIYCTIILVAIGFTLRFLRSRRVLEMIAAIILIDVFLENSNWKILQPLPSADMNLSRQSIMEPDQLGGVFVADFNEAEMAQVGAALQSLGDSSNHMAPLKVPSNARVISNGVYPWLDIYFNPFVLSQVNHFVVNNSNVLSPERTSLLFELTSENSVTIPEVFLRGGVSVFVAVLQDKVNYFRPILDVCELGRSGLIVGCKVKGVKAGAQFYSTARVEKNFDTLLRRAYVDQKDRSAVYLESNTTCPERSCRTGSRAVIHSTLWDGRGVKVDYSASNSGWLVVPQSWFPLWRATIDGAPVDLEPANGAFVGARVPAGTHHFRMVVSLWPLLWSSLFSGLLLVGWFKLGVRIDLFLRRLG